MGLMYSYTDLEGLDNNAPNLGQTTASASRSITHEDPGTLWSFGLKDDNRGQLVVEDEESVKFLGIHTWDEIEGDDRINRLRFSNGSSQGGHFSFGKQGEAFGIAYMAKNANTIVKEATTFGDPASSSQFWTPSVQSVGTSSNFANVIALRMRKIKGDKIRIWIGHRRGSVNQESNVSKERFKFLMDNFMTQLYFVNNEVIDIDDPFAQNNDYPDSFYFYPSNVYENMRWRIGTFAAYKYNIED